MKATVTHPIVCLGEVILESSVPIASLPSSNTTVIVDSVSRRLGGPALNMAAHLCSLGDSVVFGGIAGKWDEQVLRLSADEVGMDLNHVIWTDASTDLLFYFKTAKHYHAIYQKSSMPPSLRTSMFAASRGARALVFAGSRHTSVRRVYVELASSEKSALRVFAPNYSVYEYSQGELRTLLMTCDIVCLNEAEHRFALDHLAVNSLSQLVDGALLVTKEAAGVDVYVQGRKTSHPSVSARHGDFIGAGDAFLSAFVHARLSGGQTEQSAEFGTAAAAAFVRSSEAWPVLGKADIASLWLEHLAGN
jgi:sugar/nucleoside kinase (ribokinase family)